MDQNRLCEVTEAIGDCENLSELILTENLLTVGLVSELVWEAGRMGEHLEACRVAGARHLLHRGQSKGRDCTLGLLMVSDPHSSWPGPAPLLGETDQADQPQRGPEPPRGTAA